MPSRNKLFNLFWSALVVVLVLLAACAAPPVQDTPVALPATVAPQATQLPQPNEPVAPTQAPAGVTVTDSAGRQVTFPATPARVVSLTPSTTEIVCALGACDKLVGIDQFSDFPPEVKSVAKLSDGFNPNYEQIVAAKPDLVLVAGITSPDVIKKLEELKLAVVVVGAIDTSFDSIKSEIEMVGKVLGADESAAKVVRGMDDQLAEIQAKIATAATKPRVFWELDATDPAKPFTPGPGSFVNEIITRAGGENIAGNASSPYPQLNAEEVIKADPQIIILSDAAYGIAPESVGKRPGWEVITAVKDNKVFPIDDNLVSRPGPRVVEGLLAAAKLIHPELFP